MFWTTFAVSSIPALIQEKNVEKKHKEKYQERNQIVREKSRDFVHGHWIMRRHPCCARNVVTCFKVRNAIVGLDWALCYIFTSAVINAELNPKTK